MTEAQLENYAEVLLWGLTTSKKEKFRKNDAVLIQFDLACLRLAEILHGKLTRMGLNAICRLSPTWVMEKDFFEAANDKQLVFLAPGSLELCEGLNGSIHLRAPESLTHLQGIDPKRIGKTAVSRKPMRDILEKRENAGAFGWTLGMQATPKLAEAARMSVDEYDAQIVKACRLDAENPVEEWRTVYKDVQAIKRWLNSIEAVSYHIESEKTDLVLGAGERRCWAGLSGHNIPSFEIFTAPDCRSAEGVFFADQPSYRSGNFVSGVRLEFKRGKVVEASAEEGEAFVRQQIAMDKGAARLGEFSLTDKRFSRIDRFMANTLYDENYGGEYGNSHVALGSSYCDCFSGMACDLNEELKKSLGFNDSALHWDLVNTENKRVTARLPSGKTRLIYENGMFAV